jgi:hypothetical protein
VCRPRGASEVGFERAPYQFLALSKHAFTIIPINESSPVVNSNPFRLGENRKCADSAPTLSLVNFALESS